MRLGNFLSYAGDPRATAEQVVAQEKAGLEPSVPIFVASLGPKNVQMTAEVADGWIPHLYIPEHADAVWGDALRAGRADRSASLGELDIVAGGMLAVAEGAQRDQLLDLGRSLVALYVGGMGAKGRNFYNDLFVRYGYAQEARMKGWIS